MPARRSSLLVVVALLAACSAPPPPGAARAELLRDFAAAEFPGAAGWLDGCTAVTDGDWRRGDRVLFGLRLQNGERTQRWLLDLEVLDVQAMAESPRDAAPGTAAQPLPPITWHGTCDGEPFALDTALLRARVRVGDADGSELGRSEVHLPRDFLQRGFAPACEQVQRVLARAETIGHRELAPVLIDKPPLLQAVGCLMALLSIVQEDPTLAPILWSVVRKPSVASVLLSFGVHIAIEPRFFDLVPAAARPTVVPIGEPAWVVPITVAVNDTPALYCDVLVGRATPPFLPCGGIFGAEARHPTDPSLQFAFALLAARRGADPALDAASIDRALRPKP